VSLSYKGKHILRQMLDLSIVGTALGGGKRGVVCEIHDPTAYCIVPASRGFSERLDQFDCSLIVKFGSSSPDHNYRP
jgi:hypothetical protein